MELLVDGPQGLVAWHVRLRDRLASLMHADSIDARLASGVSPEETVAAALRARRITAPRTRHHLACGVERVIETATSPRRVNPFGVLDRRQVSRALPELYELRDRLDAVGAPPARGVAGARLLLADGRGPLYNPGSTKPLRESVRAVLDAFDRI